MVTRALDTDDLRVLSSKTQVCQTDVHLLYQNDNGCQTNIETEEFSIQCDLYGEIEKIDVGTETEITCFVDTKNDQDRYLFSVTNDLYKTMGDMMVTKKYTDYTITFSFAEEAANIVTNPDANSSIREVFPEITKLFPGAEITAEQEIQFNFHKIVVANVCPQLIEAGENYGAALNWSDYLTLVGGCALVTYIYSRIIDFGQIAKLSERIYEYRQRRYWEGDGQNDNVYEIFVKIMQKMQHINDFLNIEQVKKGMEEFDSLVGFY